MKKYRIQFILDNHLVAEGVFSAVSAEKARDAAMIALAGQNAIARVTGIGLIIDRYDTIVAMAL